MRGGNSKALVVVALAAALTAGLTVASPAAAALPKRAVPNYDGREAPPPTVGEVLLWVPRVALSPAYLLSEYVLRRPLGFLISEAERVDLVGTVKDVFTFGPEGSAGIVPTLLLDFGLEAGFLPSGGFYFFWDDMGVDHNDLRLRAAFGGSDWIQLRLRDRFSFGAGERYRLALVAGFDRRKDWVYAGIGGSHGKARISRYGEDRKELGLNFHWAIDERSWLETEGRARDVSFFGGGCCEDRQLDGLIAAGFELPPPGYASGYSVWQQTLSVALDSRKRRPESESGVRAEVRGGVSLNLNGRGGLGWGTYGATVGGFVDLWQQRTLGLIVHTDFADPLDGDSEVPFTELAMLGGDEPFQGFIEGRLRGRSALAVTAEYKWPIWVWMDGWLYASVGNVFGAHLEDVDPAKMRVSFGLGMKTADETDHAFQFLVAAGTTPIEQGADITEVRFAFGTTSGF